MWAQMLAAGPRCRSAVHQLIVAMLLFDAINRFSQSRQKTLDRHARRFDTTKPAQCPSDQEEAVMRHL